VGGGDIAENRTFSYQQIHAHKPLFGNQGKVLNLYHLDFDIVSTARCPPSGVPRTAENFVLRISYFSYRDTLHASRNCPLHLSRTLYKSAPFMQNKANFLNAPIHLSAAFASDYEGLCVCADRENKPNSNPIKPNFRKAKMDVNLYVIEDYENETTLKLQKNKPKTNPIKAHFETTLRPVSHRRSGLLSICVSNKKRLK